MRTSGHGSNLIWTPGEAQAVMIGEAPEPGPTVCIIGGIHGDERGGVEVVRTMPQWLRLDRGRVIGIIGNPVAVELNKRQTTEHVNLNRAFVPLTEEQQVQEPSSLIYETRRAQELTPYILASTAVLDLHEQEDRASIPFVICERDSKELALAIGPEAIAYGFTRAEAGSTDYLAHTNGIRALCYELGEQSGEHQAKNVRLGKQVVRRFLAATGLIDAKLQPLSPTTLIVEAEPDPPLRESKQSFRFARQFQSFEELKPGELIAIDGEREIRAPETEEQMVILFAKKEAPEPEREICEIAKIIEEVTAAPESR